MSEIQAKIDEDREKILRELTNLLQSQGISTMLSRELSVDYFGRYDEETVVKLANHNIQKIRLYTWIYGTGFIVYRFFYDILFDIELSSQLRRNTATKVKLIKEGEFFWLFGGKVVDIKWIGYDIAEQLNSDSKLLQRLFQYGDYCDVGQIQIYAESPSLIRILGPKSIIAINALSYERGRQHNNAQLIKLLNFGIYEMMASHIKTTIDTR